MNDYQKDEVSGFLLQVVTLGVDDFDMIRRRAVAVRLSSYVDRGLVRVSGAAYAWVNKRVADAVGPLLADLVWPSPGVASGALTYATFAAQAIIRRARMSADEYEVFVGGFRQVGVVVPPHPSEIESAGFAGA